MERIKDAELIQSFIDDCKIRNLSRHTIESYKSTLNLFSKYLNRAKKNLFDINRDILRDYISFSIKNGIDYKTIENRFSTF